MPRRYSASYREEIEQTEWATLLWLCFECSDQNAAEHCDLARIVFRRIRLSEYAIPSAKGGARHLVRKLDDALKTLAMERAHIYQRTMLTELKRARIRLGKKWKKPYKELTLSLTASSAEALEQFLRARGETLKNEVVGYFTTQNPHWKLTESIIRTAARRVNVVRRLEVGPDQRLISYWRLPGQPAIGGILPPDAPKTEPDEGVIDTPTDEMALTESEQRAISKAKAHIAELRAKYREKAK